ncbi:hypothetical protein PanWU01x14_229560 [Parasponia andersonii]|uniref:Uncharacterized protein n=1 Tax=Parasponia andersonii TaxID=3476 RepID=A0A2P5BL99_PARAD|nr:hypothetical protein PanWU01x14_229560 [Parasponia andersonii]
MLTIRSYRVAMVSLSGGLTVAQRYRKICSYYSRGRRLELFSAELLRLWGFLRVAVRKVAMASRENGPDPIDRRCSWWSFWSSGDRVYRTRERECLVWLSGPHGIGLVGMSFLK